MAPNKKHDRTDVPRKTGLISAVLAGLLVAAIAVAFVTTAKRTPGPATTDMASAEPAGGAEVESIQTPAISEPVANASSPEAGLPASNDADVSSVPAVAPAAEQGVTPAEPNPSDSGHLKPVEPVPAGDATAPSQAGVSVPGSEGAAVPSPSTETVPAGIAAAACDFPQFIGLSANDAKVEEVLKVRSHRLLPPGAVMTKDHAPDRINLDLDDKGLIRKVWCG